MLPRIRMCPHDYSSKLPCLQPSRQAQLLSNAGSNPPAANVCHEVDSGTRLSRLARFGDAWYPRAPSTRAVAWMMLREYHLARRELIGLGLLELVIHFTLPHRAFLLLCKSFPHHGDWRWDNTDVVRWQYWSSDSQCSRTTSSRARIARLVKSYLSR